nr:hypothetical protein [Tanacetum cinerariifolium]
MLDSEHSLVTYTLVPSLVEDYSNIGSPEVDGPPSLDNVPGPEEPEQAPPSPVYLPYVPELVYLEYMPPEDDVFPVEEQPLPIAATPNADSPRYILEFDPKGDPEEDDEEDPEEALPTILPTLYPTHIEIPESCLPLWKRLRFASPTLVRRVDVAPGYPMSRKLDYGITDTWDELVGAIKEIAPTTLQGAESTYPVHRRLAVLIEREARMARKAWGLSMDASDNTRLDVMSLRTMLVAQHALILDLQAADRRRQRVIKELLAADHKRQVQLTKALRLLKGLQTQMIEFQRHHGPVKGPAQPDAPGEAGSSS